MNQPFRCATNQRDEQGIALILVMLSVLVLSMLVAGLVFSSRSETLASNNYKLNTQADYLAKAGIQEAVNWFRSQGYIAMTQGQAATDYQVGTATVNCVAGCSATGPVQFIGFGSGSSNYPSNTVIQSFASTLTSVRVTGDSNDSGTFSVNAVLVNAQYIPATACPRSWDNPTNGCPVETWLITSQGTWTGGSSSSGTIAKAVETAIVQPLYHGGSWDNAVYGFCSVGMNGSAGTCTDTYDSKNGPPDTTKCNSNSSNFVGNGASVGSNGGVSLIGNVNVGGNVIIGPAANAPSGCPVGFSGSSGNVSGKVISGADQAALPAPASTPPNDSNFPSDVSTNNYSGGQTLGPSTTPPGILPCNGTATCNGTTNNPYLVDSISGSVTLTGGPSVNSPVVYYVNSISLSGQSSVTVNGYVVLDVISSVSISGKGALSISSSTPEQVIINTPCSGSCVSLSGNGAITAVVNAPNGNVDLGGGGSSGYVAGSIQANNVTMHGNFPLHYDVELNKLAAGSMTQPLLTAYSRKKF